VLSWEKVPNIKAAMVSHTATCCLTLAMCFFATAANVINYEPKVLDTDSEEFGDVDLLLFIQQGKSLLGDKSSVDTALRSLGDVKRNNPMRGLLVSQCSGCSSLQQLLDRYKIKRDDLPLAMIFPQRSDETKRGKFLLNLKGVEHPLPPLTKFLQSFDALDLKPWVRSLPAPSAAEQKGLVREVVGTTFEKEIIDVDGHVLLLMYTPGDGPSKVWQAIFEQLGKKLGKQKSIKLAQFNFESNDIPPSVNVDISKAPQIFMFRDDDKGDPDTFSQQDPHTLKALVDWMGQMLPQRYYNLDSLLAKVGRVPPSPVHGDSVEEI